MRIVSLQTFLTLPAGTVYSTVDDKCIDADDIFIKEETHSHSFDYSSLTNSLDVELDGRITAFESTDEVDNISFDFNITYGETIVDDGKRFAIWSKKDIQGLIGKLNQSLERLS